MKEKILEIVKRQTGIIAPDAAAEIEAHVFEFVEWINKNNYRRVAMDGTYWGIGRENTNYTTEQLYNHWTNIKEHE